MVYLYDNPFFKFIFYKSILLIRLLKLWDGGYLLNNFNGIKKKKNSGYAYERGF